MPSLYENAGLFEKPDKLEAYPTLSQHPASIGSFNRVPSGPREQRRVGWIATRGALPTRLNECAIFNRREYRDLPDAGFEGDLAAVVAFEGLVEVKGQDRAAFTVVLDEDFTRMLAVNRGRA